MLLMPSQVFHIFGDETHIIETYLSILPIYHKLRVKFGHVHTSIKPTLLYENEKNKMIISMKLLSY